MPTIKNGTYDTFSSRNHFHEGEINNITSSNSTSAISLGKYNDTRCDNIRLNTWLSNLSFVRNLRGNSNNETSEISLIGQQLMNDVEVLNREKKNTFNVSSRGFTLKKGLTFISAIAGLVVLGALGRRTYEFYHKAHSLEGYNNTLSQHELSYGENEIEPIIDDPDEVSACHILQSDYYKDNLSQDEYLKKIEIINGLSDTVIDDYYQRLFEKNTRNRVLRSTSDNVVNRALVVDGLLDVLQNEDIDWRVRHQFYLIYIMANKSPKLQGVLIDEERDSKLLIIYIALTMEYLKKNSDNKLSKDSFFYGTLFIEKLFMILKKVNTVYTLEDILTFQKDIRKLLNSMFHSYDLSYAGNKHSNGDNAVFKKISPGEENRVLQYPIKNHVKFEGELKTEEYQNKDDVKIIKITTCQEERETLSFADKLRVISETVKKPITTFIKEVNVVFRYEILHEGCVVDKDLNSIAEKVSKSIDYLFSFIPVYNRARLISMIAATIVDMIADGMENKDLSINSVADIDNYLRNLSKDIISSLSTKQIKEMSELDTPSLVNQMIKNLKFKNNKLTINHHILRHTNLIDKGYRNFVDEESGNIIYYYDNNSWGMSKDVGFNAEVKKILAVINHYWLDGKDISFIRNSSPQLYGDGVLARYNGELNVLVDDILYPVLESEVTNEIYRYTIYQYGSYFPVINSFGKWILEGKNSLSISEDIIYLLKEYNNISRDLICKTISHKDVTPLRLSTMYHFDINGNKYIKIDNGYYKVNTDLTLLTYIEGDDFFFPLRKVERGFEAKSNFLQDVFGIYRKEIEAPLSASIRGKYYFDNSVLSEIHKHKFLNHHLGVLDEGKYNPGELTMSSIVDGAINIDNNNYFLVDGKLIRVYKHGDDTFFLSNDDGSGRRIRIYKNQKGDTYYSMPSNINAEYKFLNFKTRGSHCIAKRQILSLCMGEFYESKDITNIFKNNKEHGLALDSVKSFIEPLETIKGFYKDTRFSDVIYYLSKDNFLFHAKEEEIHGGMIPIYFKVYGKNKSGDIDNNFLISDVSVIKDFDTMKTIIATPSEAIESIFNIDSEMSDSLQKWQQENAVRPIFISTFKNLDEIKLELLMNKDIEGVVKCFSRSGKKVVTSLKYAESFIENYKKEFVNNPENYEYKDYASIELDPNHVYLSELLDQAIYKTKKYISTAQAFIEGERRDVEEYITSKIHINDNRARDFFLNAFNDKLSKMNKIFSDDISNIIFMIRKNINGDAGDAFLSLDENSAVGFSYAHDPLDRIFIKTDILPQYSFVKMMNPSETHYAQEYVDRIFSALSHESVHALGSHEDYFYHWLGERGEFESVENTLARLEMYIRGNIHINEDFIYLCKLYFLNNPVYQFYNIDSLLRPETLSLLFQYDNYLRGVILINNPDTITAIINELNKLYKLARTARR